MKLLAQGAEAHIIRNKNIIIKKRIAKGYRFPQLDKKIRRQRTRKEAKILDKALKIIPVPKLLSQRENEIEIEYLSGKKLSDFLNSLKNRNKICRQIGGNISKLHDANIIHGDLTTSNMILKDNLVYFIDFGLSFESQKTEDKAVDMHLIKEALEAKHFSNSRELFSYILKGYKKSPNASSVLKRLEIVEKRGRYKQAY
ncbi:Kae1-associated serine/threonine protein kinase [Candidatus Pacearchaeota archaeon]|nr:Kae1-associated serine/threonine protein kinase [Candidatus Pacearchaeota archaeon]